MAKFREENSKRTKESIIKTAAKLFAKHSYSDVGLRRIAKEANSTLNTVTYHFGSKKKLFDETMSYVFNRDEKFEVMVKELEAIESLTKPELSHLLYKITRFVVYSTVGRTVYRIRSSLIDRMLIDGNPEIFSLIDNNYLNLNKNFFRILQNSSVDISLRDYRLWAMGFWSEIQFISYGKQFILDGFDEKKFNDDLLGLLSKSIARKNLKVLELPNLAELEII